MRTPQQGSLSAQALLIALADLLQDLAHFFEIGDLPPHARNLIRMQRNLAVLSAGIIHAQHPLVMALAVGACGTGHSDGMEDAAFEQRAVALQPAAH